MISKITFLRSQTFGFLFWIVAPLMLLLVNDHILKHSSYSGLVTGKLSDFSGLMVFSLMCLILLKPQEDKKIIIYLVVISCFFVFLKATYVGSNLTQNILSGIGVRSRIWPDFTDLVALIVMPVVFYGYRNFILSRDSFLKNILLRRSFVFVAVFACLFTSYSEGIPKPTVDNCGLSAANKTNSSIRVSWQKATGKDNNTFLYQVYYSTNPIIETIEDMKANGTLATDWSTDIDTFNITGLLAATPYYINVIVKASGSDEVPYCKLQATTL